MRFCSGTLRTVASLGLAILLSSPSGLLALDPHKALSQYSRTAWTRADGLPQDSVRQITQTSDGFLWLGTDEGLARFDGYDFVNFTAENSSLPSNSITALAPGREGALWIGTPDGLARYERGHFTAFTTAHGLPSNKIVSLFEDRQGVLWVAAGILLSRFESGKFTNYPLEAIAPITLVRTIHGDKRGQLWISGGGGLVKGNGASFERVLGPEDMQRVFVHTMLDDGKGGLWLGGSNGMIHYKPGVKPVRFGSAQGLPGSSVVILLQDRHGNLWTGTSAGLCRFVGGRFVAPAPDNARSATAVRSVFEDREGNLWVGTNTGLSRLRDDPFITYGRLEGWPSDQPTAVHQGRDGQVWIGFHDRGLMSFSPGKLRLFTTYDGLVSNDILAIRETHGGDLLIATRGGLSRLHAGRFSSYTIEDSLRRSQVYDVMEDSRGRLLIATSGGVQALTNGGWQVIVPGGVLINDVPLTLLEARDGSIWAGTYGKGLWRIPNANDQESRPRLYTVGDGLASNQIRAIAEDADGALWISTFGGGLNVFRDGRFRNYRARDGLLSDNISHAEDDGKGNLWLSTTSGVCRIAKQQLHDLDAHKVAALTPVNYGVEDGLRSSQCAVGYVTSAGGTRTTDGRLWIPTSFGLSILNPESAYPNEPEPHLRLLEASADGKSFDLSQPIQLKPGIGYLNFRYSAIHLRAPQSVKYAYKLDGLDQNWIPASSRRFVNYSALAHGKYTFHVRATVSGKDSSHASLTFEVLPYFYQTGWFFLLCGASLISSVYAIHWLRLQQVHSRFSLILLERTRLAREIHDTLAQGFVGISSQLDALSLEMAKDPNSARRHLDVARKMARHSLVEARRSVMNLRSANLENQDLSSALGSAVRQCIGDSAVELKLKILGDQNKIKSDVQENVLRIAQEAVTNAIKHACPKVISVELMTDTRRIHLSVQDDGKGFEPSNACSAASGHFGIVGMRERAERIGGDLRILSKPSGGTQIEIDAPIFGLDAL